MDYKEKVIALLNSQELSKEQKEKLEIIFPELKESEDERMRKNLYKCLRYYVPNDIAEEYIEWLETQVKSDKSLYIRFGDIPINGKSKIYNGEIEIDTEEGVSVYPAFEDKEGNIILGLNLPITKTSLHTQQYLLEYDSRPCYLVTGDYVGKGTDGEPLLKNVRIIKEIKSYRIKQDKENNTYVINNTPNCGISVYNDEELKESEDERIRKDLIQWIDDFPDSIWRGHYKKDIFSWLEKQGEQKPIINIPSRELILSIWDLGNEWKDLTKGCCSTEHGTQLNYIQKHWHESEYYIKEKQEEIRREY